MAFLSALPYPPPRASAPAPGRCGRARQPPPRARRAPPPALPQAGRWWTWRWQAPPAGERKNTDRFQCQRTQKWREHACELRAAQEVLSPRLDARDVLRSLGLLPGGVLRRRLGVALQVRDGGVRLGRGLAGVRGDLRNARLREGESPLSPPRASVVNKSPLSLTVWAKESSLGAGRASRVHLSCSRDEHVFSTDSMRSLYLRGTTSEQE